MAEANALLTQWFWNTMLINYPFLDDVVPHHRDDDTTDIQNCSEEILPRTITWLDIVTTYLGGVDVAKKNALTLNQVRAWIESRADKMLQDQSKEALFTAIGVDGALFFLAYGWDVQDRSFIIRAYKVCDENNEGTVLAGSVLVFVKPVAG